MDTSTEPQLILHDFAPRTDTFRDEVLVGLRKTPQKTLPCKFFYDQRGSHLFDRICELDEYYLTRTELAIMQQHVEEMVEALGPRCRLVELGSGSSIKTRILLDHLPDPAGYVPVDISREHLMSSARRMAERYPGLYVQPVCADYHEAFVLPETPAEVRHTAVYFPGSTIGNMTPTEAARFLGRMSSLGGAASSMLVGVDLVKDAAVLEAAYDDAEGITASFNKNLLVRINRELGADFELDRFEHRAAFDAAESRIEAHLVSRDAQAVRVEGEVFSFEPGETIHTENSYKYQLDHFAEVAAAGGYRVERVWTDPREYFSVQLLRVERSGKDSASRANGGTRDRLSTSE